MSGELPEKKEDKPADAEPGGCRQAAPPREKTALLKIAAISAAIAAVMAFGLLEARILPRLPAKTSSIPRNAPGLEADFPLPEGDMLMASEAVDFNGRKGHHLRCVSERPPGEVLASFERMLVDRGLVKAAADRPESARGGRTFASRVGGRAWAMLGFRDDEGRFTGLTAFRNPNTGGTNYFISRTAAPDAEVPERLADGDAPGRDIPGVARPPASIREFCIDKPAPRPSMMVLYDSTAGSAMIVEQFRSRMAELRWEEPVGSAEALAENADGALLSFRRGREYCLLNVVDEGDSRSVTVVYRTD